MSVCLLFVWVLVLVVCVCVCVLVCLLCVCGDDIAVMMSVGCGALGGQGHDG